MVVGETGLSKDHPDAEALELLGTVPPRHLLDDGANMGHYPCCRYWAASVEGESRRLKTAYLMKHLCGLDECFARYAAAERALAAQPALLDEGDLFADSGGKLRGNQSARPAADDDEVMIVGHASRPSLAPSRRGPCPRTGWEV